jgi:hypothetical protein
MSLITKSGCYVLRNPDGSWYGDDYDPHLSKAEALEVAEDPDANLTILPLDQCIEVVCDECDARLDYEGGATLHLPLADVPDRLDDEDWLAFGDIHYCADCSAAKSGVTDDTMPGGAA